MTPEEKENFYDTEIAPKLLEIGRLCIKNKLSIVCAVEWDPENRSYGSTNCLQKDASLPMRTAVMTLKTGSNIQSGIKVTAEE
jgi:hypothetical protein